jgi:hypothetical protein
MAQLSRPYQIGLVAVALLAAAWLVLLQGHGGSASTSGSASSAPATVHTTPSPKAAGSAGSNGKGSKIYHGPAPGVSGLTKDLAKANGAVATSQQNAKQLEEKSAQASSANSAASPAAPSAAKSSSSSATAPAKPVAPAHAKPAPGASGGATAVSRQHAVERQLAQGKIVLILFWDAKGADDRAVHQAVGRVRHSGMKIAVDEAGSHQVASFGTITRGVQVYGTPTLLIVNKTGKARTLTGLQDAYAITQAIQEARHS